MIELQRFIQRALLDIVGGVHGAQAALRAPQASESQGETNTEPHVAQVEFDIEVTTGETGSEKEGCSVFVATAGPAPGSQQAPQATSAGWVRFRVHVQLPVLTADVPSSMHS
jgi:hypothetical protein